MDRRLSRVVRTRADGIEVREVDALDPVIVLVRDLCYATLHRPFGVPRCDDWNESDPLSTHITALDRGALAGYARLIVEGGGGHVRQVVVEPAYRSRGLASDLVTAAVDHSRELGLPFAYLNARQRAVGMYARLGFQVVGEPFRMGRTYLPHVRMERDLR